MIFIYRLRKCLLVLHAGFLRFKTDVLKHCFKTRFKTLKKNTIMFVVFLFFFTKDTKFPQQPAFK